jgi:hypothetical protein
MLEQGKVCALNSPVSINPGLARTIGTLMKQDFQRAVLNRIPKIESIASEQRLRGLERRRARPTCPMPRSRRSCAKSRTCPLLSTCSLGDESRVGVSEVWLDITKALLA